MGSFCSLVKRNKNKWCCVKKGCLSFLSFPSFPFYFFLSFPAQTKCQNCPWPIRDDVTSGIDCKTVLIFVYSNTCEQSNKSSGARLETESETGERRPTGIWGSRASRVLDSDHTPKRFWEKTDCFAVYEKYKGGLGGGGMGPSLLCVNSNFVKLYFKIPDNSTLNKKTKN